MATSDDERRALEQALRDVDASIRQSPAYGGRVVGLGELSRFNDLHARRAAIKARLDALSA